MNGTRGVGRGGEELQVSPNSNSPISAEDNHLVPIVTQRPGTGVGAVVGY